MFESLKKIIGITVPEDMKDAVERDVNNDGGMIVSEEDIETPFGKLKNVFIAFFKKEES